MAKAKSKTESKTESFEFKTDVKEILDLVTHSLYSDKDIFLRELISNAVDATDKIRFQALSQPDLLSDDEEFKIKIIPNAEKGTLSLVDNGCGMTREELLDNLGTIAKSGTKEFMQKIRDAQKEAQSTKDAGQVDLIGQFGVGFYSAFMVADRVDVFTKSAASEEAYRWSSGGDGNFEISETQKEKRGTEIVLHLKEDAKEYLEEFKLKGLVKKYSDFVEHSIVMDVKKTTEEGEGDDKKIKEEIVEETLNSKKALWLKSKSEIKEEEYNSFYKQLSNDFNDPFKSIHYKIEGTSEFKVLVYIPGQAPFDLYQPESTKGLSLYVSRVFIMEDCKKLLPEYLRFLRGVVESNDLPLNVSRELIQEDQELDKIKKSIVKKVLAELKKLMDKDFDAYLKFYAQFGKVLKEGLHYDFENKDKIAELLLFETSNALPGELRSLGQYVEKMSDKQKEIYYVLAENRAQALALPQLEIYQKNDLEVLLLTDQVDQYIIHALNEFDKKPVKDALENQPDLGDEEDKKKAEESLKEKAKEHEPLLKAVKESLGEEIKEVRFSNSLTESVSCIASDGPRMNPQMEAMLKSMGQGIPEQKHILELNADHELIKALQRLVNEGQKERFGQYVQLIYQQALLTHGAELADPKAFANQVSQLMLQTVASQAVA